MELAGFLIVECFFLLNCFLVDRSSCGLGQNFAPVTSTSFTALIDLFIWSMPAVLLLLLGCFGFGEGFFNRRRLLLTDCFGFVEGFVSPRGLLVVDCFGFVEGFLSRRRLLIRRVLLLS